ncbi:MAG: DUF4372 domain-containing protein [Paludibacteraceae bacterium]|nr:DUF4372 domain-containing protein [Paludibacteraceae bacterium]
MNQVKYIFSQIIEFLNEDKFRRIVRKYNGDYYVKHYTCWNQLLTLIFGQLSRSASLRDVVIVLQAHLKHFYGTSLNAVKIQIFVAIITFCLVAIVQHDMKLELTTYELLHVLSVSLTSKMHLTDLLNKTNFQNDKEHLDSSEPLLFDLNFLSSIF